MNLFADDWRKTAFYITKDKCKKIKHGKLDFKINLNSNLYIEFLKKNKKDIKEYIFNELYTKK